MTESSEGRQKRLATLRSEAVSTSAVDDRIDNGVDSDDRDETGDEQQHCQEEDTPRLKFLNYRPKAKELSDSHVGGTSVPDVEQMTAEIRETIQKPQEELISIAPKKPNWDLKRDIQKDLDILQKRTKVAIAQLSQQLSEQEDTAVES